jgi:Trypsin-like peptidase domain
MEQTRQKRINGKSALVVCALILSTFIFHTLDAQNMVSSNILTRVFSLKVGVEQASGFTIDVNGAQYLITARHALQSLSSTNSIEVFRDGKWQAVAFRRIEVEPETIDIAVLALKEQLSDTLPIEAGGTKGSYLSQAVFFVGFPYGLSIDGAKVNRGFPIPLVKHGIIASLGSHGEPFLVDGINNPGFSGGPVVRVDDPKKPAIIGVVSAYRAAQEPVFLEQKKTPLTVQANTGLLVAFDLDYALEAVKKDQTK